MRFGIGESLAFGAMLMMIAGSTAGAGDLEVGDPAPGFTLQASDGKEYSLEQFEGDQTVVLAWFPKAFTGGWTAECKSLRDSGEEIRKYDVAFFAASCDDLETNTRFAESLDLDYPILSDPERSVARAYGVVTDQRQYPFRWTFYIGVDGKILHVDREVKPLQAGVAVATTLAKLDIPTTN